MREFEKFSKEEIYDHRKTKFLQIGRSQGYTKSSNLNDTGLSYKGTGIHKLKSHIDNNKLIYIGISIVLLASFISIIY